MPHPLVLSSSWGSARVATALSLGLVASVSCGAETGSDPFDPANNPGSQSFGGGGKGGNGSSTGNNNNGNSPLPSMLKPAPKNGDGKSTGDPLEEGVCQENKFNPNRLPPIVMTVLDRSGSMKRNVQGGTSPAPLKWEQTVGALNTVLNETQAEVSWGLKMYPSFPTGGRCGVEGLQIVPAFNQHAAILAEINSHPPTLDMGATPTKFVLEQAVEYLKSNNEPNPKFILLATDGLPNCRDGRGDGDNKDQAGAIAAVAAAVTAGFPVYVVGIATSLGMSDDAREAHNTLNQMATAGGKAREGDVKYFAANDQPQIVAALKEIAASAQDCTFSLGEAPPDPTNVKVIVDGAALARSDWDLQNNNTAVVIKGSWCEKLKAKSIKGLVEVYGGCPAEGVP
jgi:hypothetical protein